MRKENKKGITLISLAITVIVLLILIATSTYSGIKIVKDAKFTTFTTKMKVMQLQINSIYDKYKGGGTISIDGTDYKGEEILQIGNVDTDEAIARKDKIFEELQEDPEAGIYENEKDKYQFWSNELIKKLGIEGVEGSFFVNVEKRNFISYEGIKYEGKRYYTLSQLPDSLYNVEYENANAGTPSFEVKAEKKGESKWEMTVFNIQYSGYINKWQVKYKSDRQQYWRTSDTLNFIVNEGGTYSVKLVNGNIESSPFEINVDTSSAVYKIKETKKLLVNNTSIISNDNVKVTIPAGFTIPEESPNNAKEGIIITDSINESTGESNGNEFVWIPVNSDLTVVETQKPMAKVSTAEGYKGTDGKTNYEGVLYDFNGTESTEMESYGQGSSDYREPEAHLSHDKNEVHLSQLQSAFKEEAEKYADDKKFMETMQEDYNEMIASVKKYGGFYVGRYEMGIEKENWTPISKSGEATHTHNWTGMNEQKWYGLYAYGKKYTNSANSVKSSMIWGSQYDAMLNYALTGSDKGKVTTENGYHGENAIETGSTPGDKILNIFDLGGNYGDFTVEAKEGWSRVYRGNCYNSTGCSPSSRSLRNPDNVEGTESTRLTLYIKDVIPS